MTKDEALKLALEALRMADELCRGHGIDFKEYELEFDKDIQVKYREAITAIEQALAQPEQEPVGYVTRLYPLLTVKVPVGSNLYTAPPQRPWVDLTSKDLNEIFEFAMTGEGAVHRAIAKFKEKNI